MKICFKCAAIKPLDDFYRHPKMADGRLNKCKACTKKDTAVNAAKKSFDPDWVCRELKRHREKSQKRRQLGLDNKKRTSESQKKWAAANKIKRQCHGIVQVAIRTGKLIRGTCQVCGSKSVHAHHDDYSKPLDVIWLCPKHHGELHHNKTIQNILLQKESFA